MDELFYETFVGEFVEVTTTLTIQSSQELEGESVVVTMPLGVQGFLVDVDDTYVYLGDDVNKVRESIRKDFVARVMMTEPTDATTEFLRSLPDPKDDSEIN